MIICPTPLNAEQGAELSWGDASEKLRQSRRNLNSYLSAVNCCLLTPCAPPCPADCRAHAASCSDGACARLCPRPACPADARAGGRSRTAGGPGDARAPGADQRPARPGAACGRGHPLCGRADQIQQGEGAGWLARTRRCRSAAAACALSTPVHLPLSPTCTSPHPMPSAPLSYSLLHPAPPLPTHRPPCRARCR